MLTRKMMQAMTTGTYTYPEGVQVSAGASNLVRKILQPDPAKRITLQQIKEHKWFLVGYASPKRLGSISLQSEDDISRIVQAARVQPIRSKREQFIEDEIEE